jgi:hypothetical protein
MIEEPTIHTLVSGFPTVIVLNLLDKTMKMKRKRKKKFKQRKITSFSIVNDYIKVRPLIQGPLFCHYDGSSLSRYQFVAVLQKALMRVNIPCNRFSSHSFRIGARLTDLFETVLT